MPAKSSIRGRLAPTPPPYPVGTKIRYVGESSFSYGQNPMVEPGDVGVVVSTTEGIAGTPWLGEDLADPSPGWSTVEIKGNRIAVDADSVDHYIEADSPWSGRRGVRPLDDLPTREELRVEWDADQ